MRSENHPLEQDRIAMLRRLEILDTDPEQIYNDFVELAAIICGVPIAAISLVDQDRQWFKAQVGLEVTETSWDISFCSYGILQEEPLIVSAPEQDPRFEDNALVLGEFHLRFYAGVPLVVQGSPIGSLCVISTQSHALTQLQIGALQVLARQLTMCLEARLEKVIERERGDQLEEIQKTLDATKMRFEDLFLHMAVPSYTTDLDGTIFEFNDEAEKLFGYRAFEIFGQNDIEVLIPDDEKSDQLLSRKQCLESGPMRGIERRVRNSKQEMIWTLSSVQPLRGRNGEVTGFINAFIDISEQKRLEAELTETNSKLEHLASVDGLTQILNRRAIFDYLQEQFIKNERLSAILFDVDKFKDYNDTFGHPAGDDVLRKIGNVLKGFQSGKVRVGRYGGEEFLVALPGVSLEEATEVAEQIRVEIESQEWELRTVTSSFGVSCKKVLIPDLTSLISKADERLYEAKELGRNRVVGYKKPEQDQNTAAA